MSKHDILHSSRGFLLRIYQKYVDRACENLGIPNNTNENQKNDGVTLSESDYPKDFGSFPQAQRKKEIEESSVSDDMLLSMFAHHKKK